jgi:hypothetical protein
MKCIQNIFNILSEIYHLLVAQNFFQTTCVICVGNVPCIESNNSTATSVYPDGPDVSV